MIPVGLLWPDFFFLLGGLSSEHSIIRYRTRMFPLGLSGWGWVFERFTGSWRIQPHAWSFLGLFGILWITLNRDKYTYSQKRTKWDFLCKIDGFMIHKGNDSILDGHHSVAQKVISQSPCGHLSGIYQRLDILSKSKRAWIFSRVSGWRSSREFYRLVNCTSHYEVYSAKNRVAALRISMNFV